MKKIQKLNNDINELTVIIEQQYPELYQYLEENPITISQKNNPNVDTLVFQDYYETLNELLERYKESHKN